MQNKLDEYFTKHPKMRVWAVLGVGALLCVLFFCIALRLELVMETAENMPNFYKEVESALLDFLLAQVSMTFITISVMSVLSENNLVIYWENVVKERLIAPVFYCFSSLTIYAFVIMIFSFISFCLEITMGVIIFFILAIIDLIVLTSVMIRVYYGKESRKKELEKSFCVMNQQQRRKCLDKLQAYTVLAYENKEYEKLMENCEFYGTYTSVLELRFLFGRLFAEERLTAYECNIFEKIYEGLLKNFSRKCDTKEDKIETFLKDVNININPLSNEYMMPCYRKYIYNQEGRSEQDIGRLEFIVQTANFIGNMYVILFNYWFKDILEKKNKKLGTLQLDLDNFENIKYEDYIKITSENRALIKEIISEGNENKEELGRYLNYIISVVKRKNSEQIDNGSLDKKFGYALFMILVQLGFLTEDVKSNELKNFVGVITKDCYTKCVNLINIVKGENVAEDIDKYKYASHSAKMIFYDNLLKFDMY